MGAGKIFPDLLFARESGKRGGAERYIDAGKVTGTVAETGPQQPVRWRVFYR
jgi:hypothetical protein